MGNESSSKKKECQKMYPNCKQNWSLKSSQEGKDNIEGLDTNKILNQCRTLCGNKCINDIKSLIESQQYISWDVYMEKGSLPLQLKVKVLEYKSENTLMISINLNDMRRLRSSLGQGKEGLITNIKEREGKNKIYSRQDINPAPEGIRSNFNAELLYGDDLIADKIYCKHFIAEIFPEFQLHLEFLNINEFGWARFIIKQDIPVFLCMLLLRLAIALTINVPHILALPEDRIADVIQYILANAKFLRSVLGEDLPLYVNKNDFLTLGDFPDNFEYASYFLNKNKIILLNEN